jgi:hypothetical protein
VQVAFRASWEMIMLVIGLTLLGTSLCGRRCRIIHGFEGDGAAPLTLLLRWTNDLTNCDRLLW